MLKTNGAYAVNQGGVVTVTGTLVATANQTTPILVRVTVSTQPYAWSSAMTWNSRTKALLKTCWTFSWMCKWQQWLSLHLVSAHWPTLSILVKVLTLLRWVSSCILEVWAFVLNNMYTQRCFIHFSFTFHWVHLSHNVVPPTSCW